MKKEACSRNEIVALAQKYAQNEPEFSQIDNQYAFMGKASFPTFEGTTPPDKYLKLGLVLAGEGIINATSKNGTTSANFHQGVMDITTPGQFADIYSSPMSMLGICIDLTAFDSMGIGGIELGHLEEASLSLFEDSIIQSIMISLWQTSRGTDFSSLFFREGVEIILNRIGHVTTKQDVHITSEKTNKAKLQRVHSFILENLTEHICVSDMALEASMGEAKFFSLCRKVTGMTPFAYLTHCRLQKAKQLLGEGSSVIEASLAVGYANPSKFSASFRRHLGQTPSQWRKLNV